MDLVPGWAPNLHPLVVHFPIALLILAVALDGFAALFSAEWWTDRASAVLYTLGTLAAAVAWLTGRAAADSVFVEAQAQAVLTAHADWAVATLLFFVAVTALRSMQAFWKPDLKALRTAGLLAGLAGLFLLYQTGDRGALMVFGYGVGTGGIQSELGLTTAAADTTGGTDRAVGTLAVSMDGVWSWEAGPGSLEDLLARFDWIEGQADRLSPRLLMRPDSSYVLELKFQGDPVLLATTTPFSDVQVELEADVSGFEGSVGLVHHLQDGKSYDFVRIATGGGAISLGRLGGEQVQVMDSAAMDGDRRGPFLLRAVGSGTHFRGYLGEELLVHGHGDASPEGGAGLRIEGNGTLRLRSLRIVPIRE